MFPDIKLSVVIPCHNAASVICGQLESLVGQQWRHPWEIVLVDNCSTDQLTHIVRDYVRHFPNIRMVAASARKSQAYALNVGIANARSDAIAICDADDATAPGWVEAMGEALLKHDAVAGRIDTQKLNPDWLQATFGHHPQQKGLQTSFYPPYFPHAGSGNFGIRRQIHNAIGGFDETIPYLFDTEYCWRLHQAGVRLQYVAEATVHIRLRSTLRGIYAQSRNWSQWEVLVAKKAAPPQQTEWWRWRAYGQTWLAVLKRAPSLLTDRETRVLLAWRVGRLVGRFRGAIQFHCSPLEG
jgi:glycosyltransferase involved in cell wall biosynthesis